MMKLFSQGAADTLNPWVIPQTSSAQGGKLIASVVTDGINRSRNEVRDCIAANGGSMYSLKFEETTGFGSILWEWDERIEYDDEDDDDCYDYYDSFSFIYEYLPHHPNAIFEAVPVTLVIHDPSIATEDNLSADGDKTAKTKASEALALTGTGTFAVGTFSAVGADLSLTSFALGCLSAASTAAYLYLLRKKPFQKSSVNSEVSHEISFPKPSLVKDIQRIAKLASDSSEIANTYGDLLRHVLWEYREELSTEEAESKIAEILKSAEALAAAAARREEWINLPAKRQHEHEVEVSNARREAYRSELDAQIARAAAEATIVADAMNALEARK